MRSVTIIGFAACPGVTMETYGFARHDRYPLGSACRIRTGGLARHCAFVSTESQLKAAVAFARARQLPFYVLGKGSNVLISDTAFEGMVIFLTGEFRSICWDNASGRVTAGGGVSLIKLGTLLALRGYPGLAYMGVIPGTVGGAVRMNAGTGPEAEIKNNLLSIQVFDPDTGKAGIVPAGALDFKYRSSALKKSKKIVLFAAFRLPPPAGAPSETPLQNLQALRRQRRSQNPRHRRTFGSTFKNPGDTGRTAGWYLDRAGMKGMRCGGALVSRQHANWIVNDGKATSEDVKSLIETGQKRVREGFGITLDREVVYLPDDMDTWE